MEENNEDRENKIQVKINQPKDVKEEPKRWYNVNEDEWAREQKWFNGNELLNEKITEDFWLWEGYLPYNEISGLTGPADVGKSTLLRQLAIEIIARSESFLGSKLNTRSGRVLYISTEDGMQATSRIFQRIMKRYELTKEQCENLLFIFDLEDIASEVDQKVIDPHIDLIIADCWGDIFGGNANDLIAVRQHLKPLKALAEKYNCCLLLLHHNVKNSEKTAPDKNKMVGSQALGGKMRSLLELRIGEVPSERLLTIIKGNYVSSDLKNESLVLKLNKETISFTQERKIPLTTVVTDRGGKFDRQLWLHRINEIEQEGGIEKKRMLLKQKFPNDNIPSKSWFVENRGDGANNIDSLNIVIEYEPVRPLTANNAVEHPENTHFEGDRPVILK